MAELTYAALAAAARRIGMHESTVEDEAVRYTVAELSDGLRMTRGMLQAIADGWTQAQLRVRPPHAEDGTEGGGEGDRWSATEILSHVVGTQNWYLLHLTRLLGRREHFDVMPHGLGDLARQDVPQAELAASLREATERCLSVFEGIPADADLTVRRKAELGYELSIRGWMLMPIAHDYQHLTQIARLSDLPDFPPTR